MVVSHDSSSYRDFETRTVTYASLCLSAKSRHVFRKRLIGPTERPKHLFSVRKLFSFIKDEKGGKGKRAAGAGAVFKLREVDNLGDISGSRISINTEELLPLKRLNGGISSSE